MRNIIRIFICVVLLWSPLSGAQNKNLELDLGLGLFSDYGLLGFGGRYFLSESQDVHFSIGADFAGLVMGAGSRFYFPGSFKHWFILYLQ